MTILTVTHRTTYRYAQPVTFGEHRMMMRPRDSHDLRLLDTALTLRPAGAVRWWLYSPLAELIASSSRLA